MIALKTYYHWMRLYILFSVFPAYSMPHHKISEQPFGAASHVHKIVVAPAHSRATQVIPVRRDAQAKKSCEVQATCCQKTIKCGGLMLVAALVATTGAIAYYLYGLQGTCSRLIGPVNGINDSLKYGLPLAQDALRLANETLLFIKGVDPTVENLCNTTATMCLNAQHVCKNAETSCKNPFGT